MSGGYVRIPNRPPRSNTLPHYLAKFECSNFHSHLVDLHNVIRCEFRFKMINWQTFLFDNRFIYYLLNYFICVLLRLLWRYYDILRQRLFNAWSSINPL